MSSADALIAQLPDGGRLPLEPDDARELVAALWSVSSRSGAVVAIGKIEHRLSDPHSDRALELSELEAQAIRAALAETPLLTDGLARLRDAAG